MAIYRYWNKKQYHCVSRHGDKKDALTQAKKWRSRAYLARVVQHPLDGYYDVWIHRGR